MANDLKILIQLYPEKPWSVAGLLSNPNLDLDFILAHDDHFDWIGNNAKELSRNPTLTTQQIKENLLIWDFYSLSYNPNLTVELLDMYARK